jgi:hypothetical protein
MFRSYRRRFFISLINYDTLELYFRCIFTVETNYRIYLYIYLPTYPPTYLSSYLSIYLSVALQPFVWPWPLFQFIDLTQSVGHLGRGNQAVARPLPAHRRTLIQNKRTQTSIPQVGFEPTMSVLERAKTVYALARAAAVIDTFSFH